MKFSRWISHFTLMFAFILTGCQATASDFLPLPDSVTEATLVNFRPLTNTGRAIGAAWSPDGKSLIYTDLSFAPNQISFRDANAQPQTQTWEVNSDQINGRMLDIGTALFYGKDGSEVLYQIYDMVDKTPSIYAINPQTMKTRHFLGTQGFPSVHQLKDGRLVLSELGNYKPLKIFNPTNGELTTLMAEHPSNAPQDARISPDGKLMAYPDFRSVYLSKPDGTSPRLLSDFGGGSAKVWWSPNSQYLAYTTGSTTSDQLLLVDRNGRQIATLVSNLGGVGYISSVDWSPDSQFMLVSAESLVEFQEPTRVFLFDRQGNRQLILESYLSAAPAWSPDGRILALPLWIDPQGDEPVFDIWLADLTDSVAAAALAPSSIPTPEPTPTLAAVPSGYSPEQVINGFWELIAQNEYHAAWSMFSKARRLAEKYPEFKAFYECMAQPTISSLEMEQGDSDTMVYSMKLAYQRDPGCNETWQQPNDIFILLTKSGTTEPWQIECVSDRPSCSYQEP